MYYKSYDYDAVIYDGAIFCNECLPDTVDIESEDVSPIFADSEWQEYPVCCECKEKHDYVCLLIPQVGDEFCWQKDNFRLELFIKVFRGNRYTLNYKFWDLEENPNDPLFVGDDFQSSPLHHPFSNMSVGSLLGFLSLKPEDTDSEYFKDYTQRQLTWCESFRCEFLSCLVSDLEDSNE